MPDSEKRILIVDDDPAIRMLLFTILRRRGFTADAAKHGTEAIEKLGRCNYALVLLDLMMPVTSGWEVLGHLGRMERVERPAVILMTAGAEPREFDPDVVMGTIRKPFDVELLSDTVTGCLAAVSERQQAPDCPPAGSVDSGK
jgi:CheY-like chemotaxis protein